jgi:hypothetical protein
MKQALKGGLKLTFFLYLFLGGSLLLGSTLPGVLQVAILPAILIYIITTAPLYPLQGLDILPNLYKTRDIVGIVPTPLGWILSILVTYIVLSILYVLLRIVRIKTLPLRNNVETTANEIGKKPWFLFFLIILWIIFLFSYFN